jgi:hypothetical protein
MAMFPEFHEDDFSVMVDPHTGRVALICPAPIITFDDAKEFSGWLCYLLELVPGLGKSSDKKDTVDIEKYYATAVIDEWQKEILENLKSPKMSPKKRGTKRSKKTHETYTSEE